MNIAYFIVFYNLCFVSLLSAVLNLNFFVVEKYIYVCVSLFLFAVVVDRESARIRLKFAIDLVLILLMMFILVINFDNFQIVPVLFFIFILFMYFLEYKDCRSFCVKYNSLFILYFFVLMLIHFALIYFAENFSIKLGNRFAGLHPSPTSFAVWITLIYIVSFSGQLSGFCSERVGQLLAVMGFVMVSLLVFFSKTKINFAYMILIFLILMFKRIIFKKRAIASLVFFCFCAFIFISYYIYSSIILPFGFGDIFSRYESGIDHSFNLRSGLFDYVWSEISNSNYVDLFFGHGADASRVIVLKGYGVDLFPHNDFVRVIYDYGLVFLLLFLVYLVRISSKNLLCMLVGALYIVSYLHNMIFSFYIMYVLLFFYLSSVELTGSIMYKSEV